MQYSWATLKKWCEFLAIYQLLYKYSPKAALPAKWESTAELSTHCTHTTPAEPWKTRLLSCNKDYVPQEGLRAMLVLRWRLFFLGSSPLFSHDNSFIKVNINIIFILVVFISDNRVRWRVREGRGKINSIEWYLYCISRHCCPWGRRCRCHHSCFKRSKWNYQK